ncbi:unnamed protein product [Rangifer tarandus platyrhynchus]|uniref:Uncharacterized protein n=1 Tax=Rangifer tarandus platyrhynchus TaxID=3082113 RepID=A0AC60A0H1_RANTA
MKSDHLHFIAFNSAHKTVLFNVFLHELFVKFRSKRIIYKSFVFLLIIYTFCTVLEDNIIIPPSFEVGLRLGWASEIKKRVSTQNVFHTNPFFFSLLFLFLLGLLFSSFFFNFFQLCKKSCSVVIITLLFKIFIFIFLIC